MVEGYTVDGAKDEKKLIQVEKCKAVHELVQNHTSNTCSNTDPDPHFSKVKPTHIMVPTAPVLTALVTPAFVTPTLVSSAPEPPIPEPAPVSPALVSATPIDAIQTEVEEIIQYEDPKVLELTKMKWLSEDQEGCTDSRKINALTGAKIRQRRRNLLRQDRSRGKGNLIYLTSSPSLSPAESTTSSNLSEDSESSDIGEKYLSTILRLDKEHNLFGLSNIAIVGSKQSRKMKKEDERAVFHQTVQCAVCCASGCASCGRLCCKHRTNSDLPASLKCGSCSSCFRPSCVSCSISCPPAPRPRSPPSDSSSRAPSSVSCRPTYPSRNKCTCAKQLFCCSKVCCTDCGYGLKIKLNKKPKFEPPVVELTPRNSCVLQLPYIARPCTHQPRCCPPSGCCPYLMPCYWPSRASAPCHDPGKCFHNPACMPPRRPRPCHGLKETCERPCKNCKNTSCVGNNPAFKEAIMARYGAKAKAQNSPPSTPKAAKK